MTLNYITKIDSILDFKHNNAKDLWLAVVDQALLDAFTVSTSKVVMLRRIKAIRWLLQIEPGLDDVCELAGLNVRVLREGICCMLFAGKTTRRIARNLMRIYFPRDWKLYDSLAAAHNGAHYSNIHYKVGHRGRKRK